MRSHPGTGVARFWSRPTDDRTSEPSLYTSE